MKQLFAIACGVLIAASSMAQTVTNAGTMNVYLQVVNGYTEKDTYSGITFNQTTAAFDAFLATVTTATNAMSTPNVATASFAIFQNTGTSTVYIAADGAAFAKLYAGEISGPIHLATTNLSFWTTSGTGKLKGKVYAE